LWKDRVQIEKDESLAKKLQQDEDTQHKEMIKSQRETIKELRNVDIIRINGLKEDIELEPLYLESNNAPISNDKKM